MIMRAACLYILAALGWLAVGIQSFVIIRVIEQSPVLAIAAWLFATGFFIGAIFNAKDMPFGGFCLGAIAWTLIAIQAIKPERFIDHSVQAAILASIFAGVFAITGIIRATRRPKNDQQAN